MKSKNVKGGSSAGLAISLFKRIVLSAFLAIFLQQHILSQEHTPTAVWLFPGVDWKLSEKLKLRNQAGYNHYLRSGLWYSQAYIVLNKNVILNPGYIYLIRKNEGAGWQQEHYFLNGIILQAKKKHFLIDSRNMLWNRFTVGAEARHFYRNRVRLTQSFNTGSIPTRVYAYDELYYLFNEGKISRNRVAIGGSFDPAAKLNLDITYIRQWDRYNGSLNLYFVAATWTW